MNVSSKNSNLKRSRDLMQKELSDKVGINQSVLNRIEKGTRSIRDNALKTIADILMFPQITCWSVTT